MNKLKINYLLGILLLVVLSACKENLPNQLENENNWKINLQLDSIVEINGSSAKAMARIDSTNAAQIISSGFCYDTVPDPDISSNLTLAKNKLGNFSLTINDLYPDKKYYIRPYVTTRYTSFYGEEKVFTTLNGLAKIDSIASSEITQTTAVLSASINNDGGYSISSSGVCYSKYDIPTINHYKVKSGVKTGKFECLLEDLTYNTVYYCRAYATNKQGTSYSSIDTILTSSGLPIIKTIGAYGKGTSYLAVEGKLESDGGAPIIESGFCWDTEPDPTINKNKLANDQVQTNMHCNINNLARDSKYYFRAYAINKHGIQYGKTLSAKTASGLASIYAEETTDIGNNSAFLRASFSNIDGGTLLSYGFYWGTSPQPTSSDNIVNFDDTNFGSKVITYTLTGLTENQKYYYRYFATTNFGTVYSKEFSFTIFNLPLKEIEFVTVDGGTFTMGNNNGNADEGPEHEVKVNSFQISTIEITFNQFVDFINNNLPDYDDYSYSGEGGEVHSYWHSLSEPNIIKYSDEKKFYFASSSEVDNPYCSASKITWHGAKAFCEWVGGRLPTEAEWEFAAKGGVLSKGFKYSGSDFLDEVAWHAGNSDSSIHMGGLKTPNELGIYDMTGNVAEHCIDSYSPSFYSTSPLIDPVNTEYSVTSVLRGGSWDVDDFTIFLNTTRSYNSKYLSDQRMGFRVVKDIE